MPRSLLCYLINSAFCLFYRGQYKRFTAPIDLRAVQEEKLSEILARNKTCAYAAGYDFDSVQNFRKSAPLTTYEDYLPYIEKIANGEKNILTTDAVLLLQPTSGSAGASKLIPYTARLKAEYQCGLKPWVYQMYTACKGLKWGKSYWSITPVTQAKRPTPGGIPIGFEDDAAYFGRVGEKLLSYIFAVPNAVAREQDMDTFYFKTALYLLKCKGLTFVSVWNPTLFLLILDYMGENRGRLVAALPKKRGDQVDALLGEGAYQKLWPGLRLISCWCDANAAPYAAQLRERFPAVAVQPKGLLATEGFVSLPFLGEEGARLSVYAHFFEFLSLRDDKIYLAHQLVPGEEYEVILTTSGGLYRYRMRDIIQVVGFSGQIPRIRFVGKKDKVSDLFGEKLSELFLKSLPIQSEFHMFAPEGAGYVLYIKTGCPLPDIDGLLKENFHYKYCRDLGQLKPLKVFRLTGNPAKEFLDECAKRGQRLGDIKPTVLSLQSGWDQIFKGEYL